ncbi:unnamed protein product [Rotaria socialis]|uniref:Uncharacterized protein n=1 Tax=Rotaria socialis TaxID=392032 RepID=A0A818ZV03_9BILA|nr:unnamed protein product [Rotaria socialis]
MKNSILKLQPNELFTSSIMTFVELTFIFEENGLVKAWPLLAVGLSCIALVSVVTITMYIKYVILNRNHYHVSNEDNQYI